MTEGEYDHIPVLPDETLAYLAPKAGGRYLDGTVGLGGHTARILDAAPNAVVLGLDQDAAALAIAGKRLERFGERVVLRHCRFGDATDRLDELGWETIDGALIDVGVSSLQIDSPERGFSFIHDGPLDMRMDATGESGRAAPPASFLVNKAPFEMLKEIIAKAGEEPQAGRIARAVVNARAKKRIETTRELAAVVENAYPAKWRATARNHPATRTFQALRVTVNDELGQLREFLERVAPRLAPGGRLVVISFHSLEDRVVKHFFRDEAQGCRCPKHVPVCVCNHKPSLVVATKKPVVASEAELAANPRASSAKLRAAEKL